MTASFCLRAGVIMGFGGLLGACSEAGELELPTHYVVFAQPFPGQAANKASFPTRHQGVYTAADSSTSLGVGPTAMWRQELLTNTVSRHQAGSRYLHLKADSTYRDDHGRLHYLRVTGRDSVRDSWLWYDTLFTLVGSNAGRLRKFQGQYYLNTPTENATIWQVQRLAITGRRLTWQTLGQDTLRLLVLDTATVRRQRSKRFSLFRLAPKAGPQTRRVGDYDGLWKTEGEFVRRH